MTKASAAPVLSWPSCGFEADEGEQVQQNLESLPCLKNTAKVTAIKHMPLETDAISRGPHREPKVYDGRESCTVFAEMIESFDSCIEVFGLPSNEEIIFLASLSDKNARKRFKNASDFKYCEISFASSLFFTQTPNSIKSSVPARLESSEQSDPSQTFKTNTSSSV